MTDHKHGRIKWYNQSRGFGVILGDDHCDYFIHCSNLLAKPSEISIGTKVSYEGRTRPKNKAGLEAIHVTLDQSKSSVTVNQSNTNSNPPFQLLNPVSQKSQDIGQTPNRVNPTSGYSDPSASCSLEQEEDYWYSAYTSMTKLKPEPKQQVMEIKVVGVTHEGRQSVVARLSVNEEVLLIREPRNPYDPNAIQVVRLTGEQFGYLSRDLAARLSSKLKAIGYPLKAVITSLPGGYSRDSSLGVRIKFTVPDIGNNSSI